MTLCVFDGGHCGCQPDEGILCFGLTKLQSDLAAAVARAERAEEDAARYRWLRDNYASVGVAGVMLSWDQRDAPTTLDALIDALAALSTPEPSREPNSSATLTRSDHFSQTAKMVSDNSEPSREPTHVTRDELAEALRELTNACEDMRRNYGEDQNANVRCSHAQDNARAILARIDSEAKP